MKQEGKRQCGKPGKPKQREEKTVNKETKGYLSVASSAVSTVAKLVAGAVSLSVFTVLSAFYSCGFLIAKALCLKGRKESGAKRRVLLYLSVAGVTGASAIFYTVGAVRQLVDPVGFGYGMIPAITIAAISFYDLGAAIAGLIGAAKAKDGFGVELKRINLSGALAALALTQTALLSVSGGQALSSSGIMGVVAGAVTAIGSLLSALKGFRLRTAVKKAEETNAERVLSNKVE